MVRASEAVMIDLPIQIAIGRDSTSCGSRISPTLHPGYEANMAASDLSIFNLTGAKALVTGASRGIGRALAEGLARAGADVAVAARPSADLNAASASITKLRRRSIAVPLDVSKADDCARAVATTVKGLGGLDILVNNAGTEQVSPSLDVTEAIWDKILDTNLKGAFFCAQAAAKAMQAAGTS